VTNPVSSRRRLAAVALATFSAISFVQQARSAQVTADVRVTNTAVNRSPSWPFPRPLRHR
jgi:hypothetical protein